MIYPFQSNRQKEGKHSFWVAKSLSLKGCVGQGDTPEKAVAELEGNEEEWLSTANVEQ